MFFLPVSNNVFNKSVLLMTQAFKKKPVRQSTVFRTERKQMNRTETKKTKLNIVLLQEDQDYL